MRCIVSKSTCAILVPLTVYWTSTPGTIYVNYAQMALRLALSTVHLICDMIHSDASLSASQIAEAAGCSKQSVKHIRSNLQLYGSAKAPPNHVGRQPSITPPMLDALVSTCSKSLAYTWTRWRSFSGKESILQDSASRCARWQAKFTIRISTALKR